MTPEERAPQPASTLSTRIQPPEEDLRPVECTVCLDPLASSAALCTLHTFHASFVEGLRSFGIRQVCPMCRVELPPGPDQLNEEVARRYLDLDRRAERGESSWGALTMALQREMDEVVRQFRSASDQIHVMAQFALGILYYDGRGVQQDDVKAVQWFRKAAGQEHANARNNLGFMFEKG